LDIDDFNSKLILEYSAKIEDCNKLLCNAEAKNRFLRRENKPIEERHDVMCEMKVLNAKIIAYTQAKVDIQSIQQELGV